MLKNLITILFVFMVTVAFGQVKTGVTPTGKHAKAINSARGAKKDAEQLKEQAEKIKDYRKAQKKYKKEYEKHKRKYEKDSARLRKKTDLPDSLNKPEWKPNRQDSLAIAKKVLDKSRLSEEQKKLIQNPPRLPGRDSLQLSSKDSALVKEYQSRAESELESRASEYLPDDLQQGAGSEALDQLTTNPMEGNEPDLASIKKPSKPNPNLIKPEAAKELFQKIDPDQFQKVQQEIQKLKKKYSSLPDSRNPEEGKKRNSLEDLPFKKRIYFGGNMNLPSTDPLILDASLQLGYWINKKWMTGAGLTIREQFNDEDSISLTGDAYGYSLFTRYDIHKQFYLWGEMQWQVNQSLIGAESSIATKWEQAHLLGIGRDFKIGPVQFSTLVMYDFNYQNNNLNSRPLVFRLGFQLSKKPG